tara:strand:- start:1588 stop:1695 length:108 start_codon:yes stop_codon:yes gene_type:complete
MKPKPEPRELDEWVMVPEDTEEPKPKPKESTNGEG